MTDETIRAKLSGIRCFLLDMDGTFYLGDRIIEGSMEFLQKVEQTGRGEGRMIGTDQGERG